MLYQVEVVCNALNVRSGPSTSYSILYIVHLGDILDVYEESNNWIRIGANAWCSGYPAYVQKIETPEPPPSGDYDQGWNDAIDAAIAALEALRRE